MDRPSCRTALVTGCCFFARRRYAPTSACRLLRHAPDLTSVQKNEAADHLAFIADEAPKASEHRQRSLGKAVWRRWNVS